MADTPQNEIPQDRLVERQQRLTIDGETIEYKVTAGRLILQEEQEGEGEKAGVAEGSRPKAEIFFIAYTRTGMNAEDRPVTFAFNGGPGSSSVWLHLGILGPKRVALDAKGEAGPPPGKLIDNPHTLLATSDLVFIDPISTGFSRVVSGERPRSYHGFKRDIEIVGDFIRLYTTRYQRWASPKFLAGESYGTTRAGGLAGYLADRHGLMLNGLLLVSSVLNFQTLDFHPGNDLPAILYLPSYAATAWYHGRLASDLQADLGKTLAEAERFALGEYSLALLQGDRLNPNKRNQIARQVARFTGLSLDYVKRSDLRIEIMRFCKELLRSEGRTVGRLDSRYQGIDRDSVGEHMEHDPSLSEIMGPYSACLNHYLRADLGYESDLPYEILNGKVWPWSYSDFENRYVDVGETLRKAMSANRHLRVHVASGYFDLATPYFATEYTLSHLGLDESLRNNISVSTYEAGHMMYVHEESLVKLGRELNAFVRGN